MEEASIKEFAADFDPQPFHLDASAAQSSVFEGLAASGWHTAAIAMRLLVGGGLPLANGIIGLGGDITWPRPTRPGDILRVESEIVDITPSRSKPNRAVIAVRGNDAESERRTRVCFKRQAACVQTPIGVSSSVAKSLR